MRQNPSIPSEQRARFDAEVDARIASGIWAVALISVLLVPSTFALDLLIYPELFADLSVARFSTAAVGAVFTIALWLARRSGLDVRHPRVFVWGYIVVYAAGLDALILIAGGADAPYYAGLTLLLLAVLVSMPFSLIEMAGTLLLIILQFNLVMAAFDEVESWQLYTTANYFYLSTVLVGLFGTWISHKLRVAEFASRVLVEEEKARNEELLLNILPREVADELKAHGRVQARQIDECTILFTDFVGFTRLSGRVDPSELVRALDAAFSRFDRIMARWGIEKLKTIGDAYMCAGGALGEQPDHLVACALAGLEMLDAVERESLRSPDGSRWSMRVGIHSGPVVAGVIGAQKFAYDLWGDTVNMASRLESTAQPQSINMASEVFEQVREFFVGADRGFVPVKGRGPLAMTRVLRLRARYSADEEGRLPNEAFFDALEGWLAARGAGGRGRALEAATRDTTPGGADGAIAAGPAALRSLPTLTDEDRVELMRVATRVPIREGQVLIEEGQGLSVLLLVLDGLLGVEMARDGVKIEVAMVGPGEIVGEVSFVSLEPASATVVGLQDGEALRFDLDDLQTFASARPEAGARLFHSLAAVLAQRVRDANARLFSFSGPATEAGLAPEATLERGEVPEALTAATDALLGAMHAAEAGAANPAAAAERVGTLAAALATATLGLDAQRRRRLGSLVRRETYPALMRSSLLATLSRDGAGSLTDPPLVEALLAGEPVSEDAFGRALDAWLLAHPFTAAVRGATAWTLDFLLERAREAPVGGGAVWRVVSVLAGAGADVLAASAGLGADREGRFTCVDGDIDHLAHIGAAARARGVSERFTLVRADMLLGAPRRGRLRLVPQDVALLPFLPGRVREESVVALLDELHALLKPGGVAVVGWVSVPETDAPLFDEVLGWPVEDRAVEEMVAVVRRSVFADVEVRHVQAADGAWRALCLSRE